MTLISFHISKASFQTESVCFYTTGFRLWSRIFGLCSTTEELQYFFIHLLSSQILGDGHTSKQWILPPSRVVLTCTVALCAAQMTGLWYIANNRTTQLFWQLTVTLSNTATNSSHLRYVSQRERVFSNTSFGSWNL